VAVSSAVPYANLKHLTPDRQTRRHLITQFIIGRMLFLRQNQQCQSTEGKTVIKIKQVVKVMCHKTASTPQMDDSIVFARWRQRALPRWHIGATWQIRLNLCFLQPTRVQNQNSKLIGLAAFAQLMAESPYTLQWAPLPPKLPLPIGGSGPPSNTWFPGTNRVLNPNGSSIGSAVFAGLTRVTDRPTDS